MNKRTNIGIIGVGRFGKNYLRTLNHLDNADVSWICSKSNNTVNAIKNDLCSASVKITTDYNDVLSDKDVDAVAIVTPGSTHFSIVKKSLLSSKHVIVEKPLAFSFKNAQELVRIAEKRKKILMVSHLHLFNPSIQKIKKDIKAGLFGRINYIQYAHFGNGPVRKDMSALWDYFPHIISILLYLLEEMPLSVNASGASYLQKGVEDIVTMELKFPEDIFATAVGSWLYPLKRLQIVVGGEELYAVFDDYAKEEKLRYYNNVPKIIDNQVVIEDRGYKAVYVENEKPLTGQLKHFLDCVQNNKIPLSGGDEALNVVKVLECAQKSMQKHGAAVEVQ